MTTKKPVEEFDFDSWDEAAEEAAIADVAALTNVLYIIVEGKTFVARFPDMRIIKVPLQVSLETIDKLSEIEGDELDQVKSLLSLLGQDDDLDYLKSANLISVTNFATKYFAVLERVIGVSLGE